MLPEPLEDHRVVNPEVVDRATPTLRQLLGVDYPYPQVLDEAGDTLVQRAVSAGGAQTDLQPDPLAVLDLGLEMKLPAVVMSTIEQL